TGDRARPRSNPLPALGERRYPPKAVHVVEPRWPAVPPGQGAVLIARDRPALHHDSVLEVQAADVDAGHFSGSEGEIRVDDERSAAALGQPLPDGPWPGNAEHGTRPLLGSRPGKRGVDAMLSDVD